MLQKISFLLLLATTLNSCFVADEIFAPTPPKKEKSLQDKVEEKVEAYYLIFAKDSEYKPYGFSEIIVHKPYELIEFENLKKQIKQYPDSTELDSLFMIKKEYIHENQIERTVEVDHFYTFEDLTGNIMSYEDRITLNDTLGFKFFKPLIELEIPTNYEDVLIYYFYEYTIFLAPTYEESKELSKTFYQFFKNHLEKIEDVKMKSDFLWHILKLCKKVKETGQFDQQLILEEMVSEYIEIEREDITEYDPVQFSQLYENPSENEPSLNAYYFFHKFIGQYEGVVDTNVVLIEFSPFYEIDQIYQMDRPFYNYFN